MHNSGRFDMRKTITVAFIILIFFGAVFSDNIYLKDGTKLTGKIVSYNENSAEVLLETGKFITVNKNEIIRVDPVDGPTESEMLGGVPDSPRALPQTIPGEPSPYGQQAEVFPTGPVMDVPVPANSLPTMYGDPDIEMRKRMLMYSDMKKEPWIAAELSLLIPSAGHLYTGEWERGFLFLGARATFGGLALFGLSASDTSTGQTEARSPMLGTVGAGGFALFTLLEFVDAYYAAERYNQVLRLRLGIEKFDPMMLPTFGK